MSSSVSSLPRARAVPTQAEVEAMFARPLNDLLFEAHTVHRRHFDPNAVQVSTLLSIKTGGCPEDCRYCPQSAHYHTTVERGELMDVEDVRREARAAREAGATRFCMGAAYRGPRDRDLETIARMIEVVKAEGLETCATLGLLGVEQARRLADAGLDYYNHNLDTSAEYYARVVTTRRYEDRLETLANVRSVGLKVCSGGIVGMGESTADRAALLCTLAALDPPPESVPINELVQVEGTPFYGLAPLDPFDLVRTIAVARLLMPASHVRLSAGRRSMSAELQALCFFAGANSIFYGERLLTTPNPERDDDRRLFARLGIHPEPPTPPVP
jgi:biotin synthase